VIEKENMYFPGKLYLKKTKKNKAMTATARNSGIYCAITV
jgi:hypothetical protein